MLDCLDLSNVVDYFHVKPEKAKKDILDKKEQS